jgi:hypothetical protein
MTDPDLLVAAEVATALLCGPLDGIERVHGLGRNSGIFRVRHAGSDFALKRYPQRRPEDRNRTEIEVAALQFMTGNGITTVPQAIAADPERGYALLEWIEGDAVPSPSEADIDAAWRFLGSIHALRGSTGARDQPLAAEACVSGAEIVAQIKRRLERLGALAETEPSLAGFLDGTVRSLLVQITDRAEAGYAARGLSFAEPIPEAARTLCPADFGFHNAMRLPSGQLAFIDFDYFGWDDPVKLVCDFLLHPGMQLTEPLKRRFADTSRRIYGTDDGYQARLPLLFPLFALRWCLILLNEFLPERWAQRVNAGGEADWTRAKQDQLDRARRSVHSLAGNFRWFPYGS